MVDRTPRSGRAESRMPNHAAVNGIIRWCHHPCFELRPKSQGLLRVACIVAHKANKPSSAQWLPTTSRIVAQMVIDHDQSEDL